MEDRDQHLSTTIGLKRNCCEEYARTLRKHQLLNQHKKVLFLPWISEKADLSASAQQKANTTTAQSVAS